MNLSVFPPLNASLNASSALLLALGYAFIRQRAITAHTLCMLAATATSTVFLVCYITYHAFHGATRFPGHNVAVERVIVGLDRAALFTKHIKPICLVLTVARVNEVGHEKHRYWGHAELSCCHMICFLMYSSDWSRRLKRFPLNFWISRNVILSFVAKTAA